MSAADEESSSRLVGRPCFATTHWSVVLAAGHSDSTQAHDALQTLCRTYWYPLYAYLRRRGSSQADAQDLVQGFFAQLLARDAFATISAERGKFRSFLLASLNYYVADQRDKSHAQRRGGGHTFIELDALDAEERYRLEPADEQNPERIYERRWALTVLDEVMTRLRAEFAGPEVAAEFGLSESAIKMAVSRLRQRYRELFRAIIAETVADPGEVEAELRHLFAVISR
ncbi:MAG: sigma-70 family RNA polymerase sigma factor [Verrucomicrobia bacterium]|nr:sigma-70 family RNA polymerase sigma factor [Verrucomicrobiota bacterium]